MTGPNSVERTGASRLARSQSVRQWRLAPAAHAGRWAVSRSSLPGNESWRSVAKFSTIAGR